MPLPIENLDDWSFLELVEEGRSLLPSVAPEWTNFNASDPGITLVELFAYFTEILIFQTGQVTEADTAAFLRLLRGPSPEPPTGKALDDALRDSILRIREPSRAVTPADFELFALGADSRVARAKCLPRLNLAERNETARIAPRPGHVSVVIVPRPGLSPNHITSVIANVTGLLEPRRVLTTRIHVVPNRHVSFAVRLKVTAVAGLATQTAAEEAELALRDFFDPITGGHDGNGWPFGRSIFVSDIYQVVSKLPSSDRVGRQADTDGHELEELMPRPSELSRARRNSDGEIVALAMSPDELPGTVDISVQGDTAAMDLSREL